MVNAPLPRKTEPEQRCVDRFRPARSEPGRNAEQTRAPQESARNRRACPARRARPNRCWPQCEPGSDADRSAEGTRAPRECWRMPRLPRRQRSWRHEGSQRANCPIRTDRVTDRTREPQDSPVLRDADPDVSGTATSRRPDAFRWRPCVRRPTSARREPTGRQHTSNPDWFPPFGDSPTAARSSFPRTPARRC